MLKIDTANRLESGDTPFTLHEWQTTAVRRCIAQMRISQLGARMGHAHANMAIFTWKRMISTRNHGYHGILGVAMVDFQTNQV